MARFFLHARNGNGYFPDRRGVDIASVELVRPYVRKLIAAYAKRLDPDWVFEIADEAGEIVLIIPLSELIDTTH